MARLFEVVGDHIHASATAAKGGLVFEGSGVAFMLCMIVVSLTIISMVIFSCGDSGESTASKPRKHGATFGGGGFFSGGGGGSACGGGGGVVEVEEEDVKFGGGGCQVYKTG